MIDKKSKMTPEQEKAHLEALKENAQLLDKMEVFDQEYTELSKKYPLKNSKSKYTN